VLFFPCLDKRVNLRRGGRAEHFPRGRRLLPLARNRHLLTCERVIPAHRLGNLREIALALRAV